MPSRGDFFNLYRHGFVRVAVATPRVRIGDPRHNADATLELMQQAARDKALLAVFPELGLSAYTCDDLFHQRTLIDAAESALAQLLARTRSLPLAALVGLPVAVDGRLYNCAALVCRGRLVGVVPKTYLPNYREFYEARQFTPGDSSPRSAIALAGQDAAFGTNLLFRLAEMPAFVLLVEICEDLWVPAPPSSFAALAGASVIGNLSASNIIIGKEGYRHQLAANQSARCLAAYLYSAAGIGESTTDLAWDGHAIIYENGTLLAESQRFAAAPQLALADVDLDRLLADRMRQNTFAEGARRHPAEVARFRSVEFSLPLPRGRLPLERRIGRFPYVPGDAASRDLRCEEVYRMQMLKDIGHPYAKGRKVYDVSFENVQAGERTSHLFRLANLHGGFVVGTGDLSELALGWCTYGVGDQMSHYNVNASVPKTLIQYLVGWVAESDEFSADVKRALKRVLDTEISPELVPGKQSTEAIIGPYELQDFNLYYTLRFGYAPAKVAFLAWNAWKGEYRLREIRKWLGVFLKRFFQMSQYKRSAMPSAPKVGSGGSLSPRGDWRAPADGNASAWLADLARVPTQD